MIWRKKECTLIFKQKQFLDLRMLNDLQICRY
jgi:hypothetical protein